MTRYSTLREKLKVEQLNGNAEDLAFLTHYLHNHENGVSKSYKQKADEYYKQLSEELGINIANDLMIDNLIDL